MPNTAADWVATTRRYLLTDQVEEQNQLASGYAVGDTTLSLKWDLGSIARGSVLGVGLNLFYVWDSNPQPSPTVTVVGGYRGATDVPASAGDIVVVNPRFPSYAILAELNYDLSDLTSLGLYQVATYSFTSSPAVYDYDFPRPNVLSILEVRTSVPGPTKAWPRLDPMNYRLDRNAALSDFSSGTALRLSPGSPGSPTPWPGSTIEVVFTKPLDPLVDLTSTQSSTGLASTALDLPPLGAAIRLMAGREIKRNFTETQGDTRRAVEVPPGAVLNSANGLRALRQSRLQAELAALGRFYPARRR